MAKSSTLSPVADAPAGAAKPIKRGRGRPRGRSGFVIAKERTDEEMRKFVTTPEMRAMEQRVEREVISLGGRPPKYIESDDPAVDMPTRIFRLIIDVSDGMRTVDGCAALLGIVPDTFYTWQRIHARFADACKMGKKMQEMKAAQRMSQGVMYPTSLIFSMKNMHNWADRMETSVNLDIRDLMGKFQDNAKPVQWDMPAVTVQAAAVGLLGDGGNVPAETSEERA